MKRFGKRLQIKSFQSKLLLSYLMIIMIPVSLALVIFVFNFYNQTKIYYEDLLYQLNTRTNVIANDFITNIARTTYFYLTDNKLQTILLKNYLQNSIELLEDSNSMQNAMDQIVLMNGHIAGVTIQALNGHLYHSLAAYTQDFTPITKSLTNDVLKKGRVMVSPPYVSRASGNPKVVSIVRYLSDLSERKEGYVKVDIKFRAFENMLGGIANTNNEIGTIVIADGQIIYHSREQFYNFNEEEKNQILANINNELESTNKLMHLTMNNETYLFTSVVNKSTNWEIIQYIPTSIINKTFLDNTRNYILLSLLSLIGAFFLALLFANRFIKPIRNLSKTMKMVDSGNLGLAPANSDREDEIGQLVGSYNAMTTRLRQSREREIVSSRLQKRAEIKMIQAQINPHFLYNTLNVIHSIAELNRFSDISLIAKSLSSMYRYNIKSKEDVTIQNELEQLENYINIQKIRFPGKFTVVYDIAEELHSLKILKFLLQPIVENSFYHGLEPRGGKGTVEISIIKRGFVLYLRIKDNGVGISEEKVIELNKIFDTPFQENSMDPRMNFGLYSVHARIKNVYGDHYSIKVSSKLHVGTSIEMIIPVEKEAHTYEYYGS